VKRSVGAATLLVLALLAFFALGAVGAYVTIGSHNGPVPVAAVVIVAGLVFVGGFYLRPTWYANAVIFVACFAAMLHLPVTSDGFSSAVAIALPGVGLQFANLLARKDRHLIETFAGRFDQLLPLMMGLAMFISVKSVRELGPAMRQVQQFIYIIAIYYLIVLAVRDRRALHGAVIAFLIGGFFVELLGLAEGVFHRTVYEMTGDRSLFGADVSGSFTEIEEAGRINGAVSDAPFHGMFCTVTASLGLYEFFTTKRNSVKVLCVLIFLLSIYNVIGTGSRGAFLALGLAVFVFWLTAAIPNKGAWFVGGAIVFVAMTALMIVLMTAQTGEARAVTYSSDTSETTEMRIKNFPVAMKMFFDHPIFGIGPDGFVTNFSRYAVGLSNLASRQKVLKTHDTPAQIAAENGLVGLTVFLASMGMAMARAHSAARRSSDYRYQILGAALLGALSAYTFFMLTSNSLMDKFLWTLIAFSQILATLSLPTQRVPERAAARLTPMEGIDAP
jgi:hypothetical protein